MRVEHGVLLKNYTTFKMGGVCKNLYIPENRKELLDLCDKISPPRYILSGGSNVVVNDKKVFENVICLREFDKLIEHMGEGVFYVGSSVRLQKLILTINNLGYGGIEYLFSVPGLVGGAVTMNAGRGGSHKNVISDFIRYVYVYRDGETIKLRREECGFSHRYSCFLDSEDIVLGVEFKFDKVSSEECEKQRKQRIDLCKNTQDMSYPNFGTVFCEGNMKIIKLASMLNIPNSKIIYSRKTNNWMLNKGGSFNEVLRKLKLVRLLHRIFRKKCRQEVILWR